MVINSMEYRGAGAKVQVHKGGYKGADFRIIVLMGVLNINTTITLKERLFCY